MAITTTPFLIPSASAVCYFAVTIHSAQHISLAECVRTRWLNICIIIIIYVERNVVQWGSRDRQAWVTAWPSKRSKAMWIWAFKRIHGKLTTVYADVSSLFYDLQDAPVLPKTGWSQHLWEPKSKYERGWRHICGKQVSFVFVLLLLFKLTLCYVVLYLLLHVNLDKCLNKVILINPLKTKFLLIGTREIISLFFLQWNPPIQRDVCHLRPLLVLWWPCH